MWHAIAVHAVPAWLVVSSITCAIVEGHYRLRIWRTLLTTTSQ